MKRILCCVLLAVCSVATSIGCNRAVPVYEPNFQVQARNHAQVREVITQVLKRRRWIIESKGANYFIVRYDRGVKHSATVRIDYSATKVKVSLVKSENLLQEVGPEGEEVIHKTFNSWMRNLERDIELELSYA